MDILIFIGIILVAVMTAKFFFFDEPADQKQIGQQTLFSRVKGVLATPLIWNRRRREKKRQALLAPPSPIVRITLPRLLKHHRDLYLLFSPHGEETSIPTLFGEMARLHRDIEVQIFRKGLIGSGHYPDGLDFSGADPQSAPLTIEITWLALYNYRNWKGRIYKDLRKKEAYFLLLTEIWDSITNQEYAPPPVLIEEPIIEEEEPEPEEEEGEEQEFHAQPTLLFPSTPPALPTPCVEEKKTLADALKEEEPDLCQQLVQDCMDRIGALYQQHSKITQSKFCGSAPEQLTRSEWNILLTRGTGWCYQAGVTTQDHEGNVILAYPTLQENSEALATWITTHWREIREGKIVERV